jgi:hypothetical protein
MRYVGPRSLDALTVQCMPKSCIAGGAGLDGGPVANGRGVSGGSQLESRKQSSRSSSIAIKSEPDTDGNAGGQAAASAKPVVKKASDFV